MESKTFTLPQLFLLAATRGLLGAGIGLLISDRVPRRMKQRIGWTLIGVGALSTIPFAVKVFGHPNRKMPMLLEGHAAAKRIPRRKKIAVRSRSI